MKEKEIVKKVSETHSFLKRFVAKIISNNTYNNPHVRKTLKKYLETGTISRSEAMDVWPRIVVLLACWFGLVVLLATFALMGVSAIAMLPLSIILAWAFCFYNLMGVTAMFIPGGMTGEERSKWNKQWDERIEQAKGDGRTSQQVMGIPPGTWIKRWFGTKRDWIGPLKKKGKKELLQLKKWKDGDGKVKKWSFPLLALGLTTIALGLLSTLGSHAQEIWKVSFALVVIGGGLVVFVLLAWISSKV